MYFPENLAVNIIPSGAQKIKNPVCQGVNPKILSRKKGGTTRIMAVEIPKVSVVNKNTKKRLLVDRRDTMG